MLSRHARQRLIRLVPALVAVLALVSTACGDADEQPADRAATIEDRGSDATEPAPEGDPGERDPKDGSAAAADVDASVLEVSDLPTGWSVTPDDEDGDADEDEDDSDMAEDCGFEDELLPNDLEPVGEVDRQFQKSEVGPFLFISVSRFVDGESDAAMGVLDELLQRCRQFTSVDEDGLETTGGIQPLSFPSYGDETFAARMSIEADGMSGQGDLIAVREGDEVLLMMGLSMTTFLGAAPFGDGEFEQVVEAAVDKAFG